MRTWVTTAFLLGAAALAGVCFFWPGGVAVVESLATSDWREAAIGPRRAALLARGIGVAFGAACLAQVLGAALAGGFAVRGRRWVRGVVAWIGLVVLLTPPYLYAYAWSLPLLPEGIAVGAKGASLWPVWVTSLGRAVWCLGTWSAPLAAGVVYAGWRASGRHAYRMALLDASPARAAWGAAGSVMLPWLAVSFLIVFALAMTEYSVCHLCLVPTWNTELLAEAQDLDSPGRALRLAWPLLALTALVAAGLFPFRRMLDEFLHDLAELHEFGRDGGDSVPAGVGVGGVGRVAMLVGAVLLLPWIVLAMYLRDLAAFASMWRTYLYEWPDGLLCAAGSVVVSAWLATAVDYVLAAPHRAGWAALRLFARLIVAAAVFAAIAPPALVGDAFIAAYVRLPLIYDHWPIVSLVTAARFAVVAIVGLRLAGRVADANLSPLAAVDGASWAAAYFRVRLPNCASALGFALLVVGLLSLTEVAASFMVQPAGLDHLALTLLNQIHFGRNSEIIAMSLLLMAFVGIVVLAGLSVLRRAAGPLAAQPPAVGPGE